MSSTAPRPAHRGPTGLAGTRLGYAADLVAGDTKGPTAVRTERAHATGTIGRKFGHAGGSVGMVKRKVAPPSGRFSTQIRPPCASTKDRAIDSPKPLLFGREERLEQLRQLPHAPDHLARRQVVPARSARAPPVTGAISAAPIYLSYFARLGTIPFSATSPAKLPHNSRTSGATTGTMRFTQARTS